MPSQKLRTQAIRVAVMKWKVAKYLVLRWVFFAAQTMEIVVVLGGTKNFLRKMLTSISGWNAIAFGVHHTVLSSIWLFRKFMVPESNFRDCKICPGSNHLAHWKLSIPDIRLNSSIWNIRTQFVQALSGTCRSLRMEWNNPTIQKCWKPSQSGWTCGSSKMVTLRSKLKKCSKSLFFLQEKHRRCWRFFV